MLDLITLIQVAIFSGYTFYIYKKFGILFSISSSSYELKGNARWLFFAFLGSIGLLNLAQQMEGWGFLMTVGFLFAGITINHKSKGAHENIVHTAGTVAAILAGCVGLFLLHGMWFPTVLIAGAVYLLRKDENRIWWIEIISMFAIAGGYLAR